MKNKKIKTENYKGWKITFNQNMKDGGLTWNRSKGKWFAGGTSPTKAYAMQIAKRDIDNEEKLKVPYFEGMTPFQLKYLLGSKDQKLVIGAKKELMRRNIKF